MLYDLVNRLIGWAERQNPVVLLIWLLMYLVLCINLVEAVL